MTFFICRSGSADEDVFFGDGAVAPPRDRHHALPAGDVADDGSPLTLSDLDRVTGDLHLRVLLDDLPAHVDVSVQALGPLSHHFDGHVVGVQLAEHLPVRAVPALEVELVEELDVPVFLSRHPDLLGRSMGCSPSSRFSVRSRPLGCTVTPSNGPASYRAIPVVVLSMALALRRSAGQAIIVIR